MKKSEGVKFEEWCRELDRYAEEEVGFPPNMVAETGEDCWRDGYDDDMTPEEAFVAQLEEALNKIRENGNHPEEGVSDEKK